MVGLSTSRADRRGCTHQSTDPQCLPAIEFNNFFNNPQKHRRFASDLASSDYSQKKRKFMNYPSYHPPLKTTPSYLQTTTVAIVKQTPIAKQPFWLRLPLPPPITNKPNIPNIDRPSLTNKNRPPLLPADNNVFNKLEQNRQRGTVKDSSTNLKTLQNTSLYVKVDKNTKTARKSFDDKINQSLGVPTLMPFERNKLVKSENAGTLSRNKKLSNEGEKKVLKEQIIITSTIRHQSVEVDAGSTAAFPNPTLSSTFVMIRNPQRIRTSLQKSEETTTIEKAKEFILHTSTVSNVNTKHFKRNISKPMSTSALHTTLSEIQDSEILPKMASSTVLPVQAVETPVKLNKVSTTVFASKDMLTTTMLSTGKTTEQPSTTDSTRQAISNYMASTTRQKSSFRRVGTFMTESKILNMLSPTIPTKQSKVSMNQKTTMHKQQTSLLQTTGVPKLTVSSNKPSRSKSTPMHSSNFSKEYHAKNQKSDAINCDPLLANRRHWLNRLLNASSRNLSFLTTTLSVKSRAPQEDWTISDNRASAVGIGSIGVVVIVAIIGGVICLDAATLYRDAKRIRKKIYRIFKPLKSNNKDTQVAKKLPKWAHFVTTRDA